MGWPEASVSSDLQGQPFSAILLFFLLRGTQVCRIRSIGEGPVIYVHPTQVDFGNIYVLKDSLRILNLSNQSFIPALFRARMVSRWRDHYGMKIQLCLYLMDSGKRCLIFIHSFNYLFCHLKKHMLSICFGPGNGHISRRGPGRSLGS